MAYQTVTTYDKKYPWTSLKASPYNCDDTGTADCAASIELLKANQSNAGTIHVPAGTYKIATNLTIPTGMRVRMEVGAKFAISTGITLTINGGFDAGLYQVFSYTGTGVAVFGSGSIRECYSVWFGDDNTGVADSAAAINAAILAVKDACKVPVQIGVGTFKVASSVDLYNGVPVYGVGSYSTSIVPSGNISAFEVAEALSSAPGLALRDVLCNLTIDASANSNNITVIKVTNKKIFKTRWAGLAFEGNPDAEQIGMHFKLDDGGGGSAYYNFFEGIRFYNLQSTSGVFWAESHRTQNSFNQNTFFKCSFAPDLGYRTAVNIKSGAQNHFVDCEFKKVFSPVRPSPDYGTDFVIKLGGIDPTAVYTCTNTKLDGCWFEKANDDSVAIYAAGVASGSLATIAPVIINQCSGITDLDDIWSGTLNRGYTATFSDASTLTVAEDVTSYFKEGRKVYLDHGADGWRTSTLSIDSTYADPLTTITLNDAILTANLVTITLATDYAETSPAISTIYSDNEFITRRVSSRLLAVGLNGDITSGISHGTFTCAANKTTTVTDTNVKINSRILIMPTNQAGALLMGTPTTSLFISARTAYTSFAVTTADNSTAAAGSETFVYLIINPV